MRTPGTSLSVKVSSRPYSVLLLPLLDAAVVAHSDPERSDPAREIAMQFVALAFQHAVLQFVAFARS